jgi:hypothetical protein
MPAIITHNAFGEDVLSTLPDGMVEGDEERLAFLLGNQGPDPLFARMLTLPQTAMASQRLGHAMHDDKPIEGLLAFRDGVGHLPVSDERIGRAFALGLLGHYTLDHIAHPFVFGQQEALVAADPSLEGSDLELHGVIEADIDSWMLWEKHRQTVLERPAYECLQRTERIDRVAGALFSQVAFSVYGESLGTTDYAACVRDYELCCHVLDPAGNPKVRLLGHFGRLTKPHSLAEAMAHPLVRSSECAAANLERHQWENPWTHETSNESFADLYDKARGLYPTLAETFVRADLDRLRQLSGGLNYNGQPVEAV